MEKILIVEPDNLLCQEVMKQIRTAGYTNLLSAFSGEEALQVCQKEKPQLIILDVMMDEPDDGFFLAQKFRREGIKTPILMYTSVSKTIGFEYGSGEMVPVDDFVEKPISPDQLVEKVETLLQKSNKESL